MKKSMKLGAALAALVLALYCLAACSDDSDDSTPSRSVATKWRCEGEQKQEDSEPDRVLIFYTDKTFELDVDFGYGMTMRAASGTYTNDTTADKNGTATVLEVAADGDHGKQTEYQSCNVALNWIISDKQMTVSGIKHIPVIGQDEEDSMIFTKEG